MENELVLFETKDEQVKLNVKLSEDTVWLTQQQMLILFDRDQSVISRHINNVFRECEVEEKSNMHFLHIANSDKPIKYYSLDVIISVGYRVKSRRGVEFRRWANSVLKDYILKGYAVNNNRISQLNEVVRIMKRTDGMLDAKQVLSVVEQFTVALDLLDDYDHQRISKPKGNNSTYVLTYEECKEVIVNMKFTADSDLFGNEKDDSFAGSIGSIYQTFAGEDVYPSAEEMEQGMILVTLSACTPSEVMVNVCWKIIVSISLGELFPPKQKLPRL